MIKPINIQENLTHQTVNVQLCFFITIKWRNSFLLVRHAPGRYWTHDLTLHFTLSRGGYAIWAKTHWQLDEYTNNIILLSKAYYQMREDSYHKETQ